MGLTSCFQGAESTLDPELGNMDSVHDCCDVNFGVSSACLGVSLATDTKPNVESSRPSHLSDGMEGKK